MNFQYKLYINVYVTCSLNRRLKLHDTKFKSLHRIVCIKFTMHCKSENVFEKNFWGRGGSALNILIILKSKGEIKREKRITKNI